MQAICEEAMSHNVDGQALWEVQSSMGLLLLHSSPHRETAWCLSVVSQHMMECVVAHGFGQQQFYRGRLEMERMDYIAARLAGGGYKPHKRRGYWTDLDWGCRRAAVVRRLLATRMEVKHFSRV